LVSVPRFTPVFQFPTRHVTFLEGVAQPDGTMRFDLARGLDGAPLQIVSSIDSQRDITDYFPESLPLRANAARWVPGITLAPGPGVGAHVVYLDVEDDAFNVYHVSLRRQNGRWSQSPPKMVHASPEGHQFHPVIGADDDGRLHVAWYDDRRHGPGVWDLWYAWSDDNGRSFHEAIAAPEIFRADHLEGDAELGEYIGIACSGSTAVITCTATDPGDDGHPSVISLIRVRR
ncbi:MAG: hypothetical protein KDA28_11040, partial [Phycisphaerales bacterium]|nr:hypothetical protein [Phycisphaerales bacterium]